MTEPTTDSQPARAYSDYWQCEACGAVLYSPTTGRADGVSCWRCSQSVVVIDPGETRWRPITALPAHPVLTAWCEERKQCLKWPAEELAAADIAITRTIARLTQRSADAD